MYISACRVQLSQTGISVQGLWVLLKILILVAAAVGLVGGGLCSAVALYSMTEDAGTGGMVLVISLLFAVPSLLVGRAILRSFRRDAAAGGPGVNTTNSSEG